MLTSDLYTCAPTPKYPNIFLNGPLSQLWWHTFSLSTWKVKAGGSLWIQSFPGLHSSLQDNQSYKERLYLKTTTKTMETFCVF